VTQQQDLSPQLRHIIADLVFQLAAVQAENEALRAENRRLAEQLTDRERSH
jgi:hypothetical protein